MSEEQQPSFSEQEVQQRFEGIGRQFVEQELYAEAIEEYKELARTYPQSRWAANALMGIAECFHHLGQADEELRTLEAIAEQFPDHVVAKRAQAALRLLRGSESAAPSSSQAQEAATATGFSRQINRLRFSLFRYSMVGWALSLLLLIGLFILWRGLAGRDHRMSVDLTEMKRRVADISDQVDDLHLAALGSQEPEEVAPVRPEPPPRPTAPPPPPERPSSQGSTYTVKPGDSLFRIAQRELGDHRRVGEIARLNGLKEPYRIRVGDRLKLPPR